MDDCQRRHAAPENGNSKVVKLRSLKKSSTDGVFKNELTRATGSIIEYLNSDDDKTASELIEKLEDLREYMDDSLNQTGNSHFLSNQAYSRI